MSRIVEQITGVALIALLLPIALIALIFGVSLEEPKRGKPYYDQGK